MRGMGNLTRAAYANQRMTLSEKSPVSRDKAEYDGRATLVINVACFIFHVLSRASGDAF